MPGLVLLVQVLQGLGPVLLGLEPLGLVPVQVQALVALLGPEPVLAVLLVQVVPAQGGCGWWWCWLHVFLPPSLLSPTSNLLQ